MKNNNLYFLIFTLSIIACARVASLPASTQYTITRLRRQSPYSQPCISGYIRGPFQRDGRIQYVGIFADKKLSYPDTSGYYHLLLQPGLHTINFGTVGLLLVSIKELKLHRGDSIRLDVQMQQDTVQFRNYEYRTKH